jgi:hypothetical protein
MMLFNSEGNGRWIAIAGLMVIFGTCMAFLVLVLVLTSVYSGRRVELGNGREVAQFNAGNIFNWGNAPALPTAHPNTNTVTSPNTATNTNSTGATYLPTLNGYAVADTGSLTSAFDFLAGSGVLGAQSASSTTFSAQSLTLTGIATSFLVQQVDDFIACYRRVGAVNAQVYILSDIATLLSGSTPSMGAVAVVNQDLLRNNLLACALQPNDPNSFSAQSAEAQPCGNIGSFVKNGQTLTYVYAGTDATFCNQVQNYYTALGG